MTFTTVPFSLSKILNRLRWFLLTFWLTCLIAPTAGCYQDTPALEPQATVDLLIILLSDRDTAIRLTAAEALGKIGDQKAERFLFRALHDSDPTVREAAARSVGWLSAVGTEVETELVTLLRDPNVFVRRAAAQALGTVGRTPTLASSLAGLLTSPDTTVRQAAGHALLLVDGHETIAALSKGTTDADPVVRQWAVAALGETGGTRAVPVLLERLRHDSTASVRAEAAYRLRFLGNESVAAEMDTIVQQDSSLDVKRWAGKDPIDSRRVSTPIQSFD